MRLFHAFHLLLRPRNTSRQFNTLPFALGRANCFPLHQLLLLYHHEYQCPTSSSERFQAVSGRARCSKERERSVKEVQEHHFISVELFSRARHMASFSMSSKLQMGRLVLLTVACAFLSFNTVSKMTPLLELRALLWTPILWSGKQSFSVQTTRRGRAVPSNWSWNSRKIIPTRPRKFDS